MSKTTKRSKEYLNKKAFSRKVRQGRKIKIIRHGKIKRLTDKVSTFKITLGLE